MTSSTLDELRDLLGRVLKLGNRASSLEADSPLHGALPELDSMAVIEVIVEIEDSFDIRFEDDEVTAETFATVGTLVALIDGKRAM
ncbi:MAG: phosphopantetheine-binding protein [Gammaproteobacteria bacterium]